MASKTDSNIRQFAYHILLIQVTTLLTEEEGMHVDEDIESIHHMRVASRRLRNALQVFKIFLPPQKYQIWLRAIKRITKSLSAARDLDVHLEAVENFLQNTEPEYQQGVRRLRNRLMQQRRKLQKKVQHRIAETIKSNRFREMHKTFRHTKNKSVQDFNQHSQNIQTETSLAISPELYSHAKTAILHLLKKFLHYNTVITDPSNIKELHAMRIQAKWLRYTLEMFSIFYSDQLEQYIQAVKITQDYLGKIHDCDIWAELLPKFVKRELKRTTRYYGSKTPFHFLQPGLDAFAANRADCRTALYQDFLAQWFVWQQQKFWENLRNSLELNLMTKPIQYKSDTG